uniref:Uncharacterized protein n=1 Tax=Opuntia streptacantha TaxID=393608 RepID=A0A7C8YJI5_OPUST
MAITTAIAILSTTFRGDGATSATACSESNLPVTAHVASKRLSDEKFLAADRTGMRLRLLHRRWSAGDHRRSDLLVAGAVAAESLERRELPVAGLAREHATRLRRRWLCSSSGGRLCREYHQAICHGKSLDLACSAFVVGRMHRRRHGDFF